MKVQDIQVADKSLWQEFVNDYANGDYYQALAILQNTQLLTKAATANVMNTMTDAVDDVQALYYTNVEDKLAANLATFNTSVDNLANKGSYDQNTTYYMGNFVSQDSRVYLYISSTPRQGIPVTDSNVWLNLGLQGDEGVPSIGLNLRYDWQSTAQYNQLDVVTYAGVMYWAKQENMGQTPSGNSEYWGKMFSIEPAKIYVSKQTEPPSDPYTGLIWHEIITQYKWADVDALNYTFVNVDSKNLTWADADNGGW